jgi:hypothetical protein
MVESHSGLVHGPVDQFAHVRQLSPALSQALISAQHSSQAQSLHAPPGHKISRQEPLPELLAPEVEPPTI